MWIVLKYKKQEFNFLKKDFRKTLGDLPLIFKPKIKYEKFIRNKLHLLEKDILGDYLICYHKKFQDANMLAILKNLRKNRKISKNIEKIQKTAKNLPYISGY